MNSIKKKLKVVFGHAPSELFYIKNKFLKSPRHMKRHPLKKFKFNWLEIMYLNYIHDITDKNDVMSLILEEPDLRVIRLP